MLTGQGGCVAGEYYVSINNEGGMQMCVLSHFADQNVYEVGLEKALKDSQLLRRCQKEQDQKTQGCLVRDRKAAHERVTRGSSTTEVVFQK